MNQGRIWCVVHPTVGLPLLLGSVGITSLIVHASIMTHTTWMSTYWMGKYARIGAPPSASLDGPALSMKVVPNPSGGAGSPVSFVVTLSPAPATATTTATRTAAVTRTEALASTAPIHTASTN